MSASTPNPTSSSGIGPSSGLLAFGRGQHFCLGFHLARLEIAVMVTEWLKRVPDYRIISEAASRPPSSFQWGWNNIAGGGLTLWSYRLVAPYTFERDQPPGQDTRCLGDGQVLLRFLAAGICGSDLPGFRGTRGKLPGDTGSQRRRDGRLPDPRSGG